MRFVVWVDGHSLEIPMFETPHIVQSYEQLTAVIHVTVPRAEIAQAMGPAIAEVLAVMKVQGVTPAGPCFSYYPRRPAEVFDFEVGYPVDRPIAPTGRVKMSRLPSVKVVRTISRGPYEGLASAWAEFCAWIDAEDLRTRDGMWERYLVGPESSPDPQAWRTELNCPLVT